MMNEQLWYTGWRMENCGVKDEEWIYTVVYKMKNELWYTGWRIDNYGVKDKEWITVAYKMKNGLPHLWCKGWRVDNCGIQDEEWIITVVSRMKNG